MPNLTKSSPAGPSVEANTITPCDAGYTGPAVERLAQFEAISVDLTAQQEHISAQLSALRAQGKERSTQFRELLAAKLTNSAMLSLLAARGLD